ncbi:hypothetical protein ISF_04008 [Cordyceps fumosorosea ARSEF 2679]|uniref:Uncharacterized protein n=1 Tax=Cordyceps fumosorosea (strain ARSEF 2679) TaxID=1081104 RepID=A0A162MSD0_CORFA|nr:hypothetical protein ISF_04008 [Cordyceps fumosorosea ARSEF 2679]OAA66170.1 hypothetical protein ISF_04008 [Cordyceps fumosorosea ARSEF 2679]
MVTTAPTSPNKDGPEAPFSGSDRDTLPTFDECLAQSLGSIDSITANVASSGPKGSSTEAPNIGALIQMLGDLPLRVDAQDVPCSTIPNPETSSKAKGEIPSVGALLDTPPKSPSKLIEESCRSENLPESPVILTPPPRSPRRPVPTPLEINNPAAWRSPSQWKDHDARQTRRAARNVSKKVAKKEKVIMTEAFAVPNGMTGARCAAGAPTAMILAKVKKVFASRSDEDQEVGTENSKQHWMLSLLHGLGYIADHDEDCHNTSLPATALVMLLYEPKAYATYISAVHPETQVYHLNRESSVVSWSSNVQRIPAPPVESTRFPMALGLFQTVYSFSLPSGCPYHVLPNVLSCVHKCLKLGGSFKLTIIDPLPYAETLGHRLRFWMERHLFPNLERNSRCLEPSRLFPKLLGDAGLRGKGSRRTKVKFFALQENARGLDVHRDPDPSIERMYQEQRDKAELRSLVGRMFWMEVWGPYVTPGSTWWWDDPSCVEECLELGTFWEYHVIDSVKFEQNVV